MSISITVEENVTQVTVEKAVTKVVVEENNTVVNVAASDSASRNASSPSFTPQYQMSATNVQDALEELRDQFYRSDTAPTGNNLDEGDLWYDTDDNQLKVYRETSTNVFEFVPLVATTGTMDNLDGGLF